MPQNGFTVGRDASLNLTDGNGNPIDLGGLTNFSSRPDHATQKIVMIDGRVKHLRFPQGWTGSFTVERRDAQLDTYFANVEAGYYLGLDEKGGSILETITEVDGSITQWLYTEVMLKLDDAGDYSGDKSVRQQLSFMASQRKRVN